MTYENYNSTNTITEFKNHKHKNSKDFRFLFRSTISHSSISTKSKRTSKIALWRRWWHPPGFPGSPKPNPQFLKFRNWSRDPKIPGSLPRPELSEPGWNYLRRRIGSKPSKQMYSVRNWIHRERTRIRKERERERRSRVCVLEKKKKERNPEEA